MGLIAAASVAAAASAYSAHEQVQAGKKAETIANINAENQRKENEEQARRMKMANTQQEGMARARAAAGGGKLTGTVKGYLEEMSKENLLNVDWMRKTGEHRASIMEQEGKLTKKQAYAGAAATAGQAIGSIGTTGTQAGWWE